MGLILDSSVLIGAERQGQNARQTLIAVSGKAGNAEIALSVVTLIELAHGAARADTPQRRETRQQFIQELVTAAYLSDHGAPGSPCRANRWREPSREAFVFRWPTC